MDNRPERGERGRLRVKDVVLLGLLGGLMFAAKIAMAGLPNIEPVSLLVMLYAAVLGRRALYPIYIYVGLEVCVWGLSLWCLNYLYVWLILCLAAWALRKMRTPLGWALLSGTFGLLYGLLCTPVYLAAGGWAFALSWWVSGIPFDIAHGAGNFVLALVLFAPLRRLLEQLTQTF